jgi:hypothetical protein
LEERVLGEQQRCGGERARGTAADRRRRECWGNSSVLVEREPGERQRTGGESAGGDGSESESEADDEAAYQAELRRRDSLRVRWAASPPVDETRKRLIRELGAQQVSRRTKSAAIGVLETNRANNYSTAAAEYGCVSGGQQYSATAIFLQDRIRRIEPEPRGGDSSNEGTGHGALNLASVAHSDVLVAGCCTPVDGVEM